MTRRSRPTTPGSTRSGRTPGPQGCGFEEVHTKVVPQEATPKPIPKKFKMLELPKYNRTIDPNEHVTAYTCAVNDNDIKNDKIESVLLKKFRETLSKGAMMWYHNLDPNSVDSFAMLADSFIRAHAGTIKVVTRKSDVFKIKQTENEMLREFVSRFQMEQMELPPVFDDWAVLTFTQGLKERSSVASKQLKQNMIEYSVATWPDVYNWYQSKIRAEDDQLGAPSGLVYPNRLLAKEPKPNKERYQLYIEDRRNAPRGNLPRSDRRVDQGQDPRGLIDKARFDHNVVPTGAPHLSEYNFNVDVSDIRDAKWPKPI
ncbi:uncharacterized protein [Nicotiana sylvestris]|uniref:uncharacterized protein n=1 Tax=Nicotiana sylvestris TaxID=4096 RepID=UPI00388C65CD